MLKKRYISEMAKQNLDELLQYSNIFPVFEKMMSPI